jgi:hypothetical protein
MLANLWIGREVNRPSESGEKTGALAVRMPTIGLRVASRAMLANLWIGRPSESGEKTGALAVRMPTIGLRVASRAMLANLWIGREVNRPSESGDYLII